jgi:hypothetical protein
MLGVGFQALGHLKSWNQGRLARRTRIERCAEEFPDLIGLRRKFATVIIGAGLRVLHPLANASAAGGSGETNVSGRAEGPGRNAVQGTDCIQFGGHRTSPSLYLPFRLR